MSLLRSLAICLIGLLTVNADAQGVPTDCTQLILGIAPTWNSMRGELRLFERNRGGEWVAVAGPFPVLFGKNGVAWGTGLAGQNEPGLRKQERDGRAPAGIFAIGQVFGYDPHLPAGGEYPYHQVTEADVWSDDPRSPNYNRHIVIDPKHPPDNYTHEKMRSGDFAYHWLVEIRHNSDPPVPGAGSAIFFHIRRGVNRPTTGCTTMARENLVKLITWLRVNRHPCYALLPAVEYDKKWRSWNLPTGPPLAHGNLRKSVLHPLLGRLGIPKDGLHAFRHSRVTQLRRAGTQQDLQKQWIGHSSLRTGDRYRHTLPDSHFAVHPIRPRFANT
jgi:L,D-peptidoglycan transpeptidase YkuD (ErfK/YbiS/YcfS/YnhG family)